MADDTSPNVTLLDDPLQKFSLLEAAGAVAVAVLVARVIWELLASDDEDDWYYDSDDVW